MTDQMLKLGDLSRSIVAVETREIDEEARTAELVFSSEEPVQRWFGTEILGHGDGEVDLGRVEGRVCPLLLNHDWDRQVGAVISARVDGGRGVAVVKFSRSAAASEVFQDVVDGLRDGVSVGYRIHALRLEEETDEGAVYRATRWEVLEISLASVPADVSVGVGRSDGEEVREVPVEAAGDPSRDDGGQVEDLVEDATRSEEDEEMPETTPAAASATAAGVPSAADALAARNTEIAEILRIAARHNMTADAETAILKGINLAEFRGLVLDRLGDQVQVETPAGEIGMTDRDVRRFSLIRAVNAFVSKDWSRAGFEREVTEAVQERVMKHGGQAARGFYLPFDVLSRDLSAGGSTTGAELVGTDHLAGSFIERLRNRLMIARLGARTMSGLVGDVSIPKMTGGATAYWLSSETANTTESTPATGAVTMTPKHVSGRVDITRQMRLQSSPDVDAVVRDDLVNVMATAIDLAAINGSGASGQPRGILNVSGIGDVAGGTNGLAPTWAHVVELETDVSVANADMGSLAYLTNAKVRGKLKTTEKASGTAQFVWDQGAGLAGEPGMGSMNGYRAAVSTQVPDDLDKGTSTGVCSAIIFGNFADLMIGEWGILDLFPDPYTSGDNGAVIMRAFQSVDVAVRHAESFSAMQDALT